MNYPVSNPLQILGDDSTYHSITKYSNISKIDIIPSKVYYTQRNVAEYSWSSRAQCAKNIMPEYQSCSLAVPLPRQGKFPALCNKLQTMSCTFLHVTALATNHIFHSFNPQKTNMHHQSDMFNLISCDFVHKYLCITNRQ